MKILIVSRFCTKPSWHGSAQHAQSFAKELINQGHRVVMLSGEYVEKVKKIEQDNYTLHQFPLKKKKLLLDKYVSPVEKNIQLYNFSCSLIDDFKPDFIHLGAIGMMLSCVDAAYEKKIKISAMFHDFFWISLNKFHKYENSFDNVSNMDIKIYEQKNSPLIKFIAYFFDKLTFYNILPNSLNYKSRIKKALMNLYDYREKINLIIVQNKSNLNHLLTSGFKNKVQFIPQGLTEEKLKKYEKNKSSDILNFGYVGRYSKEKGLNILFDSLLYLLDNKKFMLTLISSGLTKKQLLSDYGDKIKGLNIKIVADATLGKDVSKEIAQLDLLISPSIWMEIGPRTVIEAIAQKVPCIVSSGTGNSFLINNKNGAIFSSGNANELFNVLNKIVENPIVLKNWSKNLPLIYSESDRTKIIIKAHKNLLNLKI